MRAALVRCIRVVGFFAGPSHSLHFAVWLFMSDRENDMPVHKRAEAIFWRGLTIGIVGVGLCAAGDAALRGKQPPKP
jgi:hypothetical protein